MKRFSNIYQNTLLPLLTTLLLTSCTLVDNDLRDLPDTPGFKEIVTVDTEEYHLEYKYNKEVRVLDKVFLSYITSSIPELFEPN